MERNHEEYPGRPPIPPKKHSLSCYVYVLPGSQQSLPTPVNPCALNEHRV